MKIFKLFIFIILINCFTLNVLADSPNLSNAFLGDDSPLNKIADGAGYNQASDGSFDSILATIIQTALSLLGVFFMLLMVYGGFLWMNDRGNSDYVEKAKKLITAAFIGMIIVLLSYAISVYVFKALSEKTLGS